MINWSVWAPVLGVLVTAICGLVGLIFQARKNHRIALEQIAINKEQIREGRKQSEAALKQADAALEASKASAKTAHATAEAAIQDAFTRAYEAASSNWSRFCDANDRTIESFRQQVGDLNDRIEESEIRSEGYRQARDEAEKNLRIALAWIRRALRWINEQLPGATSYPPLPPELDLDL